MRVLYWSLTMSTLLAAGACGNDPQAFAAPGTVTSVPATEVEAPLPPATPLAAAPVAAAPRPRPAPAQAAPVYRAPAPAAPQVVTQTHVKRDAAIGAGVGAVAGAIIHDRNRWKGAVVGGVIGGAAGAVVGATVDKSTRVIYP